MWEKRVSSPEASPRETTRRVLGRAAASLVGGALVAAPFSLASSIDRTQVRDDLGPVPTTISLAPGYTSVDLGALGSVYDDSLTGAGVGLRVEVDGPPRVMESINTNNPNQLIKPFASFYQDPTGAIEGYQAAVKREFRHELLATELQTTAILSTLAFIITSFGRRLPPNERKRFLVATFGGMSMLSALASAHVFHQWHEENTRPVENYPIAAFSTPDGATVTASNPLLAGIIDHAAPLIEEQKVRNDEETARFLAQARHSIDQQLAAGDFIPPAEGETLVLALSDLHSNRAMIEVYRYLVERVNQTYGDDTLELTLLVGDQTYGSATEKSAVDAISRISEDMYGISGNHDGELIEEQAEARGIELLTGETESATDDLLLLGAPDPSLTKLSALFGFGENVLRSDDIDSQEELGEQLADTAEATDPAFILSHEAYALESLLDKDDISPASMTQWLAGTGEAADIPAGAVLYGHWHRQFDYRVVRDELGHGTVVAELGTAGGASGKMSLGSLSFPWTTPAKKASGVLFRVDTSRQLVTGLQEITTSPAGEVIFQSGVSVSQPNLFDDPFQAEADGDKLRSPDRKSRSQQTDH